MADIKRGKYPGWAALGAIALFVVILAAFDPESSPYYPACPFHAMTGLFCPGCGTLRAMHALLHGDFSLAFAMNPLAVVAIPVLMLRRQIRSPRLVNMRGKPAMRFLSGATSWLAIAAAVVHFGVVRNLPWYPFDLLAPGAAEHYVTAPPQDDPDPAVQP